MNDLANAHDAAGALLAYPGPGFSARVGGHAETIVAAVPEAVADLAGFADWARAVSPEELEEHYTLTFDNSAKRALEVGWHVFGETYDRGAFLVELRNALRRAGIRENGELPDHLSHVLALLGRLDGTEAAALGRQATPALAKVAAELAKERNPYVGVVDAAWKLVASYAGEEVVR